MRENIQSNLKVTPGDPKEMITNPMVRHICKKTFNHIKNTNSAGYPTEMITNVVDLANLI